MLGHTRLVVGVSILSLLSACKTGPERAPNAESDVAAAAASVALAASVAPAVPKPMSVPEPTLVAFPSGARKLRGFLYRPAGDGPFPAIVFNHGSEKLPGTMAGQAQFFVPHGYAVFVPHRRGHGQSSDAGEYIGDVAEDPTKFVSALDAQEEDVSAAVAFLATQPFVDPRRIAVSGCSLGGIESLLAAERDPKITAAIDFAGGAIMWSKSPMLQERMKAAARNAKVPVFFLQAENDFDTTPSRTLDAEMRAAHRPSRLHVFAPNGATHEEGHAFCTGGRNPAWGPEVLEFLASAMTR